MSNKPVGSKQKTDYPDTGFFGPDSHLWLNHRYLIRAVGYPVAVIIIFMNPMVYEIISSYTAKTPSALKKRLLITKQYSFAFVFGSKSMALKASATLREAHKKIKHDIRGVIHSPLEPDLMLWVFAALYYTSKKMNELLLINIPFNAETYKEYKILGQLYGVPDQYLPDTMEQFDQYWENTLNQCLVVTEESKAQINAMLKLSLIDIFSNNVFLVRLRIIFKPLDYLIHIFCIYFLPQQIADKLGLRLSTSERVIMKYMLKCIRQIHAILPKLFTVEKKVRRVLNGKY